MNRRSKKVRGYVKFPVGSKEFRNSSEGGMLVRLVVVDESNKRDKEWMVCCGGHNEIMMDESFLCDDKERNVHIPSTNPKVKPKDLRGYYSKIDIARETKSGELFHFPRYYEDNSSSVPNPYRTDFRRYLSIGYLCVMTIGSTGWSGWSDKRSKYWHCTYADLTSDGKDLYRNIKKLYGPRCRIYLQTWLDT